MEMLFPDLRQGFLAIWFTLWGVFGGILWLYSGSTVLTLSNPHTCDDGAILSVYFVMIKEILAN